MSLRQARSPLAKDSLPLLERSAPEDRSQAVEQPPHLHHGDLVGARCGNLLKQPAESVNLVENLDMAARHCSGWVCACGNDLSYFWAAFSEGAGLI